MKTIHYKIIITLLLSVIAGLLLSSRLSEPSTSIDLYHWLNNESNMDSLDGNLVKAVEPATAEELRNQILEEDPTEVRQYTVLVYGGSRDSILIESTPGTRKQKVMNIRQLPDEIGSYFKEIE